MNILVVPIKKMEECFTVFALLILMEPVALVRFISDIFLNGKFSIFMNVFYLAISFISCSLLAVRWRNSIGKIKKSKILWLLIILLVIVLLSCLWSSSAIYTFKRSIVLLQVTSFGAYFATRYKPQEQLQLLVWAFSVGAVLSLIFILTLPQYGVMGMGTEITIGGQEAAHIGKWRGIYSHKNPFGRVMSLGAVTALLLANDRPRHRWLIWTMCSLMIIFVVASRSSTALVVFFTLIAFIPFYRILRFQSDLLMVIGIPAVLLLGSSIALLVGSADTFASAFGKNLTFSGRTDLWATVIDEIFQQPLLGYGYKGYWQGFNGPSAVIWSKFSWLPPHSHNGLLDVWLDLGSLGLTTLLISFVFLAWTAIFKIRKTKMFLGLFPALFLTFMFLSNLTESALLRPDLFWVLYFSLPFLVVD